VLPASIPFRELKGRDLEECVYLSFAKIASAVA